MKKIIGLLVFVILLSACAGSPSSTLQATPDESYPGPVQALPMEGYPGLGDSNNGTPIADVKNPGLPEGQLPSAPSSAPKPESGKGSVSGTIFSFTTRIILADTMFYLTPAMGPEDKDLPPALFGPQEESGDIVGKTDEKGQFSLTNVPPGNYFLIVEAPMNWAVGLEEGKESAARMLTIEEGKKYPLGVVFVSWP